MALKMNAKGIFKHLAKLLAGCIESTDQDPFPEGEWRACEIYVMAKRENGKLHLAWPGFRHRELEVHMPPENREQLELDCCDCGEEHKFSGEEREEHVKQN